MEPGNRIGILAKNNLEFCYLLGAAAKVGAILAPLNWRLSPSEMAYIISDSSPVAFFVDSEFQGLAEPLIAEADKSLKTFSMGAAGGAFESFDSLMKRGQSASLANIYNDDRYVIIYTAAVQGTPRGAVVTQQGALLASLQLVIRWGLGPKDVSLAMLPLFHIAGLLQVFSVMLVGGNNIMMPGFDAEAAAKRVEENNVTVFLEFPPMLTSILDQAEKGGYNLSSIRHVAGIDNPETVKRFENATGATFWAIYGQSETSGLVTMAPYFERLGSAGFPVYFSEVDVVDDAGNLLERGKSGEIVARGPQIFAGYWNREEDTRYTFRDGWHHTGDMGRIDEDGYLWFEGRAEEKELIKPGGENVYPAEVEKIILECPMVTEAVVIGVPDPKWGEAIKAICVLSQGACMSEADFN